MTLLNDENAALTTRLSADRRRGAIPTRRAAAVAIPLLVFAAGNAVGCGAGRTSTATATSAPRKASQPTVIWE